MPLNLYPNVFASGLVRQIILSGLSGDLAHQLELFAMLNLGIVQSLAIERFYHADNCLYGWTTEIVSSP